MWKKFLKRPLFYHGNLSASGEIMMGEKESNFLKMKTKSPQSLQQTAKDFVPLVKSSQTKGNSQCCSHGVTVFSNRNK